MPVLTVTVISLLQVPHRVAAVCCKELSRLPKSPSGSGSSSSSSTSDTSAGPCSAAPQPSHAPGRVAWFHRPYLLSMLHALLGSAASAGIIPAQPTDNPGPQAAAIAQQVQQSGLLQVLPQVLTSMADLWQRLLAAGTASGGIAGFGLSSTMQSNNGWRSSPRVSTGRGWRA